MRITVLSGGIGGARFLSGLLDALGRSEQTTGTTSDPVTVIGNTADDIWLFGLEICPDLDTVMYTLGGGIDDERGWGRQDESGTRRKSSRAYGVEPTWFGLGDRDLATHLVRTQMLGAGYTLTEVTAALCARWQPGRDAAPDERRPGRDPRRRSTPDDDPAPGRRKAVHFQEYWVRLHAPTAHAVIPVGVEASSPAPGVIEAIEDGRRAGRPAVQPGRVGRNDPGRAGDRATPYAGRRRPWSASARSSAAPRSAAWPTSCCRSSVSTSRPRAVGEHYGARSQGGLIDAWLVDEADAADVPALEAIGPRALAVPLYMTDPRRCSRARPAHVVARLPRARRVTPVPPHRHAVEILALYLAGGPGRRRPDVSPARQLHPPGRRRRSR